MSGSKPKSIPRSGIQSVHRQLEMFGYERTVERVRREYGDQPLSVVKRKLEEVRAAHEVLSEPMDDHIAFLHSGLCQTALPHRERSSPSDVWHRSSGRFHLMVTPGTIIDQDSGKPRYVGVPYGTRARLIMLYLQTEGMRSRTVSLGKSMSSWIRSLGLPVTGGERGTIRSIKEQSLRISRCQFTLQWDQYAETGNETIIKDSRIVEGLQLSLWETENKWNTVVHLSEEFHEHLKNHAVPLDNRAISYLASNSLGLDLYAMLAHRLHRVTKPVEVRWASLREQFGSDISDVHDFAVKVRKTLAHVLTVYPHADVEVTRHGLILKPSAPPIPKQQSGWSAPGHLRAVGVRG